MNQLFITLLMLVASTTIASAQSGTLKADSTALRAEGGTAALTAVTEYAEGTDAVGWEVQLPEGWTVKSVEGPNVPGVAPATGATGVVEFAYIAVPPRRSEFTFIVQYPPAEKYGTVAPTVFVRAAGNLVTLKPESVTFTKRETDVSRPADK